VLAQEWLDSRGIAYELVDVLASQTAYDTMIALSNQRYTPTLVVTIDNQSPQVLADFGPEELHPFLSRLLPIAPLP
jgi:glutaredoxin